MPQDAVALGADTRGDRAREHEGDDQLLRQRSRLGALFHEATNARSVAAYYHTDAIGSVRMTTDAAGAVVAVVARYDYLPFGQPWPSDQDPEPRRFAGYERDLATGGGSWEALDYAGARYYSSQTGRFTGPDPVVSRAAITRPQAWNRYAYAFNNPLAYSDPDGRWPFHVHNAIYEAAFGGILSPLDLLVVKSISFGADFGPGALSVTNAHAHSMCAPDQSAGVCSGAISGFISHHLDAANRLSGGGRVLIRSSLMHFALAVHALTDKGSPAHVGDDGTPFTWTGSNRELMAHIYTERSPSADWSRIGQSIRLAIQGFAQAFPALAGRRDISAWSEDAINRFIDDYFGTFSQWGRSATDIAAARSCALGNPAACSQ